MSRAVRITADDFGLCPEANDAICLLHDRGIVTRASFLVNTDWFEPSVGALRERPRLDVAVHLNLTDGRPILPPADVPTLVDEHGCFHGGRHYGVIGRIAGGRMSRREIHREWRAQIAKARAAGIVPRELNAHGHLHLLPQLHEIDIALMREFGIPEIRLIRSFDSARGFILHCCSLLLARRLRRNGFRAAVPGRTLGLRKPGEVDSRIRLDAVAPEHGRTAELIVHPSNGPNEHHRRWGYHGDAVLRHLLDAAASGPNEP